MRRSRGFGTQCWLSGSLMASVGLGCRGERSEVPGLGVWSGRIATRNCVETNGTNPLLQERYGHDNWARTGKAGEELCFDCLFGWQ